jgi:hypothetical protein
VAMADALQRVRARRRSAGTEAATPSRAWRVTMPGVACRRLTMPDDARLLLCCQAHSGQPGKGGSSGGARPAPQLTEAQLWTKAHKFFDGFCKAKAKDVKVRARSISAAAAAQHHHQCSIISAAA